MVAPSLTRHRRPSQNASAESKSRTPTAAEHAQMIGAAVNALAVVGSSRLQQRAAVRQPISGRSGGRRQSLTRTAPLNAANMQRQTVSETTTPFTSRPSSPPALPHSLPTSPSTLPSLKHPYNVPSIQPRTHRRNISKTEPQPPLAPLNEEADAESRTEKRVAQNKMHSRRTHETDAGTSDEENSASGGGHRQHSNATPLRGTAQQVRHATAPSHRHYVDHALYTNERDEDDDDDDDEFVRRLDITSDHRPPLVYTHHAPHRIPPIQLGAAVRTMQPEFASAAVPRLPPVASAQNADSYRSIESPKLSDYSASPSPSISSSRSYSYSSADDIDKDESSMDERTQERLQQSKMNTDRQHYANANDQYSQRQQQSAAEYSPQKQHRANSESNGSTRETSDKIDEQVQSGSAAPPDHFSLLRSLSKSQSHAKLQSRPTSRPHSSVSSYSTTPVQGTPIASEQILIPTDVPPLKNTNSNAVTHNVIRPSLHPQQLHIKVSNDARDDDGQQKSVGTVSSASIATPRSPRHDLSAGYMYDPILKCYFDPTTNKYFEVIV